jgi:phosphatidylserine decarboxylase
MVLDGILYGAALLLMGAGAAYLGGIGWAAPLWALAAFVLYFFRDPDRIVPAGAGVVSPADGRVVDLRQTEIDGRPVWKISIFLNIFNVHVNRSPIAGVIRNLKYTPGRFLIASRREASVENEQNTVTVEQDGETVVFKQIAGAVARRIVFNKKVGDTVERGERVGLIKFGSRVDLFLPLDYAPEIAVGDRVKGGSSWIAKPVSVSPRSAVRTELAAQPGVEQLQSR